MVGFRVYPELIRGVKFNVQGLEEKGIEDVLCNEKSPKIPLI
jgi:hypothetical protein